MTDISTIMVEAAEAERAKYCQHVADDMRNFEIFLWTGDAALFTGSLTECKRHMTRLVVQAQLRALHAAGLGIGEIAAVGTGDDWRVEGPDLVSAALRENG